MNVIFAIDLLKKKNTSPISRFLNPTQLGAIEPKDEAENKRDEELWSFGAFVDC